MSDVNQIEISADGQDITITIGDYSDADARQAISVTDAGGDGSLAYNNTSGVITYTGPSASEVRAHFTAGAGISIASGVITNTRADTNTTYTQNASAATGGANLNLVGSDATTDTVKFANGTNVTVTRTDADTITIASTDTNTTYTQGVTATTGGANLNLIGSDSTTDTVKFAAGAGITVAETDASTITVTSTITQYTDTLARQAISVATNTGDGDLTYNNTNGQFSYTGPGTTEYRAAIGVSNASGDGSLAYSTSTGVITYTGPTNSNYRGAVSAANSGTGYGSLSYDTPTGVFTFAKVTGANIRSEVVDGRNLTYTGGGSTLDLDKALTAVNSITAETATNLTLTGDELVLQTVDVDNASQFLNLNSPGYTYDVPLTTAAVVQKAYATNVGTTSATFKRYILIGDVTLGSNLITNAVLYTEDPGSVGTVVDWTTVTDFVTLPILDYDTGYFDLGVAASSVGSITGTYDPDPGTNTQTATVTLTVRDSAIATTANCQMPTEAGAGFDFAHYIRNSTATNVAVIGINAAFNTWNWQGPAYRDASNNGYQDGADIAVTYVSYDYTGTQDWQITPRRILNLQPKNAGNEHIRVPFGLGVGPGSVMTNRGLARDQFDAVGININNNGKLTGFTGKTGLNLTQFKNNSSFQSGGPAERSGPNFTFNCFAGNEDTANNALYLNNNDGIGQITWFAQPLTASPTGGLASSTWTPASITVKATETHDATTKQGAGMYLQYTPNTQGSNARPRTFLRAEDATVEMLAKTTIKLGKFNNSSSTVNRELNPTVASPTPSPATYWVTVDDSAVAVNTGLRITGGLRTYGEFSYTNASGFAFAAQDTIYTMPLDTTNMSSGTSISNTSRINISRSGIYKIIISLQATSTHNGVASFDFWLRKNGTDVTNSKTQVDFLKDQKSVVAMDWMVESDGDDYWEIAYATASAAYAQLAFPTIAATTTPFVSPLAPALIVNVIPIGA